MTFDPGDEIDQPESARSGKSASPEAARRQRRRTIAVLTCGVVLFGAGVIGLGLPARNNGGFNVRLGLNGSVPEEEQSAGAEPVENPPPVFAGFITSPRGDLVTTSAPPTNSSLTADSTGTVRPTTQQTGRTNGAGSSSTGQPSSNPPTSNGPSTTSPRSNPPPANPPTTRPPLGPVITTTTTTTTTTTSTTQAPTVPTDPPTVPTDPPTVPTDAPTTVATVPEPPGTTVTVPPPPTT
jgi:hypothetical protein